MVDLLEDLPECFSAQVAKLLNLLLVTKARSTFSACLGHGAWIRLVWILGQRNLGRGHDVLMGAVVRFECKKKGVKREAA